MLPSPSVNYGRSLQCNTPSAPGVKAQECWGILPRSWGVAWCACSPSPCYGLTPDLEGPIVPGTSLTGMDGPRLTGPGGVGGETRQDRPRQGRDSPEVSQHGGGAERDPSPRESAQTRLGEGLSAHVLPGCWAGPGRSRGSGGLMLRDPSVCSDLTENPLENIPNASFQGFTRLQSM